MRALSLLLFTLLAGPAFAQETGAPTGCKDDNADCKEGCTIEYGGSSRTYAQLGSCLQKCKQTYDKCAARHLALQKQKEQGGDAHKGPEIPAEPTPASKSAPAEPTGRTGVYRASESKTVADPDPETKTDAKTESKPAEKPASQEDPADDLAKAMDPEPAAKPEPAKKPGAKTPAKPKPAAKPEPTAKPEPEKPVDSAETQAKPVVDQDVPVPPATKDEPKPEPKPQPKPEPAKTKPPPTKRDIDDWDPSGK